MLQDNVLKKLIIIPYFLLPIYIVTRILLFLINVEQDLSAGFVGLRAKNICYHVAVFVILFNLICNVTIV